MTRISSWWPWMLIIVGIVAIGWTGTMWLGARGGKQVGVEPTLTVVAATSAAVNATVQSFVPPEGCLDQTVDMPNGQGEITISRPSVVYQRYPSDPTQQQQTYIKTNIENSYFRRNIVVDGEHMTVHLILPLGIEQIGGEQIAPPVLPPGTYRVYAIAYDKTTPNREIIETVLQPFTLPLTICPAP